MTSTTWQLSRLRWLSSTSELMPWTDLPLGVFLFVPMAGRKLLVNGHECSYQPNACVPVLLRSRVQRVTRLCCRYQRSRLSRRRFKLILT